MALLEQLCWAKGFYRLHMCRPDLLQLQAIEECCPIYMLTFVLLLRPPSCIDQQSPERTGRSWKHMPRVPPPEADAGRAAKRLRARAEVPSTSQVTRCGPRTLRRDLWDGVLLLRA